MSVREADAAGRWVFDTRDLIRRPGSMKTFSRVVQVVEPIGTDVIAVPVDREVTLELRLESVVEGILATGTVASEAAGVCVRCLDRVEYPLDLRFQELFAYADRAAHHHEVGDDEDEDRNELDGYLMDLESVLRDVVVTALPFQPICRDDCPGLCPQCGARLADDPDHEHDLIDPRWSALASLAGASAGGQTPTEHETTNDNEKRK